MNLPSFALKFACYPEQKNAGGPPGFIAKNYKGHKIVGCDVIYPSLIPQGYVERALRELSLRHFKHQYGFEHSWFSWLRYTVRRMFKISGAHRYRALYFHDPAALFFCDDLIASRQLVFLHPHMPELLEDELVTMGSQPNSPIVKWAKELVTAKAFQRANVLILPNPGVFSIYESVAHDRKIEYLASGSAVDSPSLFGRIPLDPGLTHFLFVGRRQRIKGFDELIAGFRLARQRNERLMLYLAGGGAGVKGEPGVVDLGTLENPFVWMKSVDAVVSTNTKSYFDRTVIEALGIGANLLMSCTYGHSELAGKTSGIIDIGEPTVENIASSFLKAHQTGFPGDARQANMALYAERYSDVIHRKNLERMLKRYEDA
jgi:glycosyltransferase involved in cell wall biosynthesis